MPVVDEHEEPRKRRTPFWVLMFVAMTATSLGTFVWSWNEPEIMSLLLSIPSGLQSMLAGGRAPARAAPLPPPAPAVASTKLAAPAFDWAGRWVGSWVAPQGVGRVGKQSAGREGRVGGSAFSLTISHQPNSRDYRVLYEWHEGDITKKRGLSASAANGILVCRELSIQLTDSGTGVGALAIGQFPQRHTANLVRNPAPPPKRK